MGTSPTVWAVQHTPDIWVGVGVGLSCLKGPLTTETYPKKELKTMGDNNSQHCWNIKNKLDIW